MRIITDQFSAFGIDEDFVDYLPEGVDFQLPKREYTGMSGNYQVVVRVVYDHIFLSRKYGRRDQPAIKVSWRFNEDGRIDLIDGRLLPEKTVHHIISVKDFESIETDWTDADAYYGRLPDRINIVNPGFANRRFREKYQSLLRFGHAMMRDILSNLDDGNIRDSYVVGDNQRQLREIVQDSTAMYLMDQAGQLLADVEMSGQNHMHVGYRD
jgi:hypothetical protein